MPVVTTLLLAAWLGAAPWPGPSNTPCTSTDDALLNRWLTVCDDGSRAVSTWNGLLERWETTVTPPAESPRPAPWGRERR